MFHVFLSVSIIFLIIYGIEGFGVEPEKILARLNDKIKICCFVEEANGTLNFYDGNDLVPAVHVNRVNDTYIEFTNVFSKPTRRNFTCKQDKDNVGLSEVFVDRRMAPVENFRCRTRDLVSLNCSFNQPKAVLPITYHLSFKADGELVRPQLSPNGNGTYNTLIALPTMSKNFNELSFAFKLIEKSKHYMRKENFTLKLMEALTPNPIDDVKVMDNLTNVNSALISFKLPKELEKVAKDMIFDVRLRVADESLEWKRVEHPALQLVQGGVLLSLNNLAYANIAYAVKIRMKANIASDNDESWSLYKEVAFNTRPKLPETLPQTCANCFNVMDNGNIVVYWMEVSKLYRNADNFSYLVNVTNEDDTEILHRQQIGTSMVLPSNLTAESLKVQIFSVNSEGTSKDFSGLFIPRAELHSLNKTLIIRKELVQRGYNISWKQLQNRTDVESYTIIWCRQRNELVNQCDDSIEFRNIPAEETFFTKEASSSSQFGLAINYRDKSIVSGFEWAECTAARPDQIGQVHSMWTNVNAQNSVTVYWNLRCADEAIVVGYNITYCMLDHESFDKCEGPEQSKIELLKDVGEIFQYDIVGLKTYRFYNISIALMSSDRLGVHRSPVTTRTLEGAPTAPRDLRATKIDNSSIEISWNRPLEVNGESITYEIWYNGQKKDIEGNSTLKDSFSFSINQLESFTNYTITVRACTSECSNSSYSLKSRTAVGTPGKTFQPTMKELEKDRRISWEPPSVAGGDLNYFDLKLSIWTDQGVILEENIYRLNGRSRSCIIEDFKCDNKRIEFFVRAVNVEEETYSPSNASSLCFENKITPDVNTTDFIGEWSPHYIYDCTIHQSLFVLYVVIIATFSIVSSYMFVRLYKKYLRMKDIKTEWPRGLDPKAPPGSKDSFERVKDLDLVKDHVLTDIEEEDEEVERKLFLPDMKLDVALNAGKQIVKRRELSQSESMLNPLSNEYFRQLPNVLGGQKKVQSAPATPEKHEATLELARDCYVDSNTGYMKMNPPARSRTESSTSVDGYLDMNGKASSPLKSMPPSIIIEAPTKFKILEAKKTDYVTNEIEKFVKDSEINNNGYIGKRMSIVCDPHMKRPPIINSNGYVGFQQK